MQCYSMPEKDSVLVADSLLYFSETPIQISLAYWKYAPLRLRIVHTLNFRGTWTVNSLQAHPFTARMVSLTQIQPCGPCCDAWASLLPYIL
jgi:hypothetical protein